MNNAQTHLFYRTYELGPQYDWVVFVHGAGGSSTLWFRQIRAFKKRFNVLLVDLRGHGHSASRSLRSLARSARYTFDDIATEVVEAMDHAGVRRAHFVGMSLGSVIIRSIAESNPERVQSMILGGAIMRLNFRSRFLVVLGNIFKRVIPYMWLYRFFAWIIMPRANHRESRTLFAREAKKLCQREFIRWFKLTSDINPLLRFFREKDLPIPTLYLMGEQDHLFLPPVQSLVKRHKHSELRVIADCGHVCNIEQPVPFNSESFQFLQRFARMAD